MIEWVVDTVVSYHAMPNKELFATYKARDFGCVKMGNTASRDFGCVKMGNTASSNIVEI